jgi:hypothetical protein
VSHQIYCPACTIPYAGHKVMAKLERKGEIVFLHTGGFPRFSVSSPQPPSLRTGPQILEKSKYCTTNTDPFS